MGKLYAGTRGSVSCLRYLSSVQAALDIHFCARVARFEKLTALTRRDSYAAKQWIRERARGTERHGLLAFPRAMRLEPHGIDIRVSVDPVHYFLNGNDDTRSSYYLDDAATEFQVQGKTNTMLHSSQTRLGMCGVVR